MPIFHLAFIVLFLVCPSVKTYNWATDEGAKSDVMKGSALGTSISRNQNSLIDAVGLYGFLSDKLKLLQSEKDSVDDIDLGFMEKQDSLREKFLDIHCNLVFIGFPITAVKAMKDKWFDSLDKVGKIFETIGVDKERFQIPGKISARYHFHVINTSFHLADVIRKYFDLLLRPYRQVDKPIDQMWYLNSREVDLVLKDLSKVITKGHIVTNKDDEDINIDPAEIPTIFVINPDLKRKYIYLNDFSPKDILEAVRTMPEVVSHSKDTLKDITRSSRLIVEPSGTRNDKLPYEDEHWSMEFDESVPDDDLAAFEREFQNDDDDNTDRPQSKQPVIYWRDAVQETAEWASRFAETHCTPLLALTESDNLRTRMLAVFDSVDDETLGHYKHYLAAQVAGHKGESAGTGPEVVSPYFIANSGFVWTDTSVSEPLLSCFSTPTTSQAVDNKEWLNIGLTHMKSRSIDNITREIATKTRLLQRLLATMTSLLRRCSLTRSGMVIEARDALDKDQHEYVETLKKFVTEQFIRDHVQGPCAELYYQRLLLNTSLEASFSLGVQHIYLLQLAQDKQESEEKEEREFFESQEERSSSFSDDNGAPGGINDRDKGRQGGEMEADDDEASAADLRESYEKFVRQQSETLSELLRNSATLSGMTSIHAGEGLEDVGEDVDVAMVGLISSHAVSYLSQLSSSLLRLMDEVVLAPIQQHLDPHLGGFRNVGIDRAESGAASTSTTTFSSSLSPSAPSVAGNVQLNASSYYQAIPLRSFLKRDLHRSSSLASASSGDPHYGAAPTDITEWLGRLPSHTIHDFIEITIYVVHFQDSYAPTADPASVAKGEGLNAFDYWVAMTELSRLSLPHQKMVITLHSLNSTSESSLGLALASCRRTIHPSSAADDPSLSPSPALTTAEYIDAACMWSHIDVYDSPSSDAAPQRKSGRRVPSKLHIPVYLLSVDNGEEPLYLNGMQQVHHVGNSILVVQNRQKLMPVAKRTLGDGHSRHCHYERASSCTYVASGRNPIGGLLQVAGVVVGGLRSPISSAQDVQSTWHGAATNSVNLVSQHALFSGQSPLFLGMGADSIPRFSTFDITSIRRNKVLRFIGIIREQSWVLLRAMVEIDPYPQLGERRHPIDTTITRLVERLDEQVSRVVESAASNKWAAALRHCGTAAEMLEMLRLKCEKKNRLLVDEALGGDRVAGNRGGGGGMGSSDIGADSSVGNGGTENFAYILIFFKTVGTGVAAAALGYVVAMTAGAYWLKHRKYRKC